MSSNHNCFNISVSKIVHFGEDCAHFTEILKASSCQWTPRSGNFQVFATQPSSSLSKDKVNKRTYRMKGKKNGPWDKQNMLRAYFLTIFFQNFDSSRRKTTAYSDLSIQQQLICQLQFFACTATTVKHRLSTSS